MELKFAENGITFSNTANIKENIINTDYVTTAKDNFDKIAGTTTTASTINGLDHMSISSLDKDKCSYTLKVGNTELTTDDLEFIHKLNTNADGDCAAALVQMIEDYKRDNGFVETRDNGFVETSTTAPNSGSTTKTYTGNMYKWKENKTPIERENEETNMELLKNFKFGPCGDRAKISHLGIAIQNTNGEWVSWDKENNNIVNVDLINFGSNIVYMIPVALKDIQPGDAILHNKHIMFVKKIKENTISALDVSAGEVKTILPTKSIFGFDFITKLVSLIDMSGINANEDSPFGDMLPLLLLGDQKPNDKQNLLMAMMAMNGNFDMSNPMMLMFLMNEQNGVDNVLPFILMNQMKKN